MGAVINIEAVGRRYAPQGMAALFARRPAIEALADVNLAIPAGQTVGLLGESGSGKTTLARLLLRLDRPSSGRIRVDGQDIAKLTRAELARYRRRAQLVFQNPFEAFNPRLTLGRSLAEPLTCAGVPKAEGDRLIAQALARAGLAELHQLMDRRPGEVSGGQLQRAAVARAIVLEPGLLVADEPVSMLDVSIRAGVLSALRTAQESLAFTAIYISHDLTLVRTVCSRTVVLYRGGIVEDGDTAVILRRPLHPYTKALVAAVPRPRVDQSRDPLPLVGAASTSLPSGGCRFRDRCPNAVARCAEITPVLAKAEGGHHVACHLVNS